MKLVISTIPLLTCTVVPSVVAFSVMQQSPSILRPISSQNRKRVVLQSADIDFDPTTTTSRDNIRKKYTDATPRYGWQKMPPKESLKYLGQDHTAPQWTLNAIEVGHYLSIPSQFAVFLSFLQYVNVWATIFDNDVLRLGLWIAAPLVQTCALIAPVVMHIYEDWQIAPGLDEDGNMVVSRSNPVPVTFYSAEVIPNINIASNERLREICQSILFTILGVAHIMLFHAFQGWSDTDNLWRQWSPVVSIVLLTYSCLGDKNQLISRVFNRPSLSPITISTALWFVYSQIVVTLFVYFPLANMLGDGNYGLKVAVVLSPFVTGAGGVVEGLIGETTFNQKWHLLASSLFVTGNLIQAATYFNVGAYLSTNLPSHIA